MVPGPIVSCCQLESASRKKGNLSQSVSRWAVLGWAWPKGNRGGRIFKPNKSHEWNARFCSWMACDGRNLHIACKAMSSRKTASRKKEDTGKTTLGQGGSSTLRHCYMYLLITRLAASCGWPWTEVVGWPNPHTAWDPFSQSQRVLETAAATGHRCGVLPFASYWPTVRPKSNTLLQCQRAERDSDGCHRVEGIGVKPNLQTACNTSRSNSEQGWVVDWWMGNMHF